MRHKPMKPICLVAFVLISQFLLAQEFKRRNYQKTTNPSAYRITQLQNAGIDSIQHIDSLSGYSILIPEWWKITETSDSTLFGGTLPKFRSIENSILLKAFSKDRFENFTKFEGWVLKNYSTGERPVWSNTYELIHLIPNDEFNEIGASYQVAYLCLGHVYQCCYILVETNASYLWIDYTATSNTYEANFKKFKSLLGHLKIHQVHEAYDGDD